MKPRLLGTAYKGWLLLRFGKHATHIPGCSFEGTGQTWAMIAHRDVEARITPEVCPLHLCPPGTELVDFDTFTKILTKAGHECRLWKRLDKNFIVIAH
jgi:hypothetical protein